MSVRYFYVKINIALVLVFILFSGQICFAAEAGAWNFALEGSAGNENRQEIESARRLIPGWRPSLCPKPGLITPTQKEEPEHDVLQDGPYPLFIKADELKYQNGRIASAMGNVQIDYRGFTVKADQIYFDQATGQLTALGNVTMIRGKNTITGSRLTYNLITEKAEFDNARGVSRDVVIRSRSTTDFYFQGEKITLDENITIKKGRFTTCDLPPDESHYYITGEEITIYPQEKIIIDTARFYKNHTQFLGLHRMKIPLKSKAIIPFIPQVGRNSQEGSYVKLPVYYNFGNNMSGILNVDYYSRVGLGGGLEHNYNIGEQGAGKLKLYTMGSPNKNQHRYLISNRAYYRFPEDYFASVNYTAEKYRYPGIVSPAINNFDLYFGRERERSRYALYLKKYRNGDDVTRGINFFHQYKIDDRTRSDVVIDYNLSETPTLNNYQLSTLGRLVRQGDIFDTWFILDKTWSKHDFYVNRLPELSLRSHAFNMGPFQGKIALSAGSFYEMPSGNNSLRSDLKFSILNRIFQVGDSGAFSVAAGGRQFAYGSGERKYLLKSQLAYEQKIGKNFSLIGSHYYQDNNGITPLAMDYYDDYSILGSTLEFHLEDKLHMQVTGGYNLDKKLYQTIVPRMEYCPSDRFKFILGSTYDYNNRLWMNMDGEAGIKLGRSVALKYWGFYDLINKKMTYQNYVLEYASHDFVSRVIYKGNQGELWIDINLRFLSPHGPDVGPNPNLPVVSKDLFDGAPDDERL